MARPGSDAHPSEARYFARLSQELMRDAHEQPTMQAVVERAVDVVSPCSWAAISFRRRRGRLETVAASDPVAERCDQLQYDVEDGPCVDAALHEDWYFSPDLSTERRWPTWAPHAVRAGVHSVLAIRLSTMSETLGALNLYSKQVDGWTHDDLDLALVYAVHAANALGSARIASGLEVAMEGRHAIGIAQGMLMVRYDLTRDQAFEVLRRLSSERNLKLREVAARIVSGKGRIVELLQPEPGDTADGTVVPEPG